MTATDTTPALTALQADVLHAAFATGETGVVAWRRWRDAVDWDAHLDQDEFRLLPRIGRNLGRARVADPLLSRLQGITRQAWYANQRWLRHFHPTLQALAASGVEFLIVPPASVLLDDATAVLEPYAPLTCAVRGAHAESAMHGLEHAGWRTGLSLPRWSLRGYVLAAERLAWYGVEGHTLDLSWQWDARDRSGRFPAEVWERARPARLANMPVLAMETADALHHLCRQPHAGKPFARMVDLLTCLTTATPPLDWHRFLARSALAPIAAGWRGIVAEAHSLFPDLIPAAVVADWPVPAPSPAGPSGTRTMRARVAAHWAAYRRAWGDHYSFGRAVRHLPGYLLGRWRLPAPAHLPRRAWRGLQFEWRDAQRNAHRPH